MRLRRSLLALALILAAALTAAPAPAADAPSTDGPATEAPVVDLETVMAPAEAATASFEVGDQCIWVMTFARNPDTGECQEFGSPCHVPAGWEPCFPGS